MLQIPPPGATPRWAIFSGMPCCRTNYAPPPAARLPCHCCFGSHVKAQRSPQKKVVLSGWNGLHSAASARHLGGGRGAGSKGSGGAFSSCAGMPAFTSKKAAARLLLTSKLSKEKGSKSAATTHLGAEQGSQSL